MKRLTLSSVCAFAAAVGLSGGALAQPARTDAYTTSGATGEVVRNPFGMCWRTPQWTEAKAIAECDPDLVKKPEPRQAQPAPAPVPAPVARIADSDGDGVPDNLDQCPGTPAGARVDARGCELDSDRDGIVDRLDRCPGTVTGAKVDASGCELDSDRDGIVDRLDKCPGTRAGVKVDASGCEIPAVVVLKGVTFATNSARLTPASASILDEAAATLMQRSDVKTEVAGHTDNRGSPAANKALSQQRAEAVMRYLVSKGVNAANLSAVGYGQERPIADNATEAGRAANRRVELRTR